MIKTTYVIGHRNPDTASIAHIMEYPQQVLHLLKILAKV